MATLLNAPIASKYKAAVWSSGSGVLHLSPSMVWVKMKLLFPAQDLTSVYRRMNVISCSGYADLQGTSTPMAHL